MFTTLPLMVMVALLSRRPVVPALRSRLVPLLRSKGPLLRTKMPSVLVARVSILISPPETAIEESGLAIVTPVSVTSIEYWPFGLVNVPENDFAVRSVLAVQAAADVGRRACAVGDRRTAVGTPSDAGADL